MKTKTRNGIAVSALLTAAAAIWGTATYTTINNAPTVVRDMPPEGVPYVMVNVDGVLRSERIYDGSTVKFQDGDEWQFGLVVRRVSE